MRVCVCCVSVIHLRYIRLTFYCRVRLSQKFCDWVSFLRSPLATLVTSKCYNTETLAQTLCLPTDLPIFFLTFDSSLRIECLLEPSIRSRMPKRNLLNRGLMYVHIAFIWLLYTALVECTRYLILLVRDSDASVEFMRRVSLQCRMQLEHWTVRINAVTCRSAGAS